MLILLLLRCSAPRPHPQGRRDSLLAQHRVVLSATTPGTPSLVREGISGLGDLRSLSRSSLKLGV